jgi:hypothetical protein
VTGRILAGVVDTDAALEAERQRHMRDTALGRIQAATHLRQEATTMLMLAIRGAHRCGATVRELEIESGEKPATIRRVVKGGSL